MEIAIITFSIGALIFLAQFFTQIFKRFQIPDVLFLVGIGLVLGPITGLIDVSDFGILGELFATLTLLIILFEAGLGIKLRGLFSTAPKAITLMLLTLASTIAVVLPIGIFFLDIPFTEVLLAGVLLGGVSAGIAVPLLKNLPVGDQTKSLITFETNLNDVVTVGIVFAILDFVNDGFFDAWAFSTSLGAGIIIALLIGSIGAFVWSRIILKVREIQNNVFMTPALVLMVFGISEMVGASGIFAAFAFGITLGNLQFINFHKISPLLYFEEFRLTKWEKRAFSDFVFIFKTYFFVFIGLSIGIEDSFILAVAALTIFVLYGMRLLAVEVAVGHYLPSFDRQVLHRLIPKGLVGAALITLVSNEVTRDFTYGVILFSIVLTSILIFLLPEQEKTTLKREAEEDVFGEDMDTHITRLT
jgi:NhaP-type Na+/H+ or K+/H+ antiporter